MPALGALGLALALVGLRGRIAPRTLVTGAATLGIAAFGLAVAKPDVIRAESARAAFEIARDHPLAGVGPGGFAEAFPQYRRAGDDESRHAFNLPAELAAEWAFLPGWHSRPCSSGYSSGRRCAAGRFRSR